MDREEYPVVAELGDAPATACISEGPSVDSLSNDGVDMASLHPEHDPLAPEPVPALVADGDSPSPVQPEQVIEALLFATDAPLSAGRLAELAGTETARDVREHIATLNEKYAAAGLAFRIEEIARGFQMLTLPAYRPWLAKLEKHRGQTRLTGAALETLSIIAYKQPVIRADIEAIRGVASGEVLNRLREMGLIKIMGRAEIVGRPILYGTTRKFLEIFGLSDLDDLPPMESLMIRRPAKPEPQSVEPATEQAPEESPVAAAGA